MVCQTGNNEKSKVFLDTIFVTIDDNKIDHWVGTKLNITLGPQLTGMTPAMTVALAGTQ